MKNKKFLGLLVLIFLFSNILAVTQAQEQDPFFHLTVRISSASEAWDYFYYIQEMLEEINIELETEWIIFNDFPSIILFNRNWDLIFSEIRGWRAPDLREYFTSNGQLNLFGLDDNIPYVSLSNNMQEEATTLSNQTERQQRYYDWQELVMDKILPILPLYAPRLYCVTWSSMLGFDGRWGIVHSLPYMEYDGYHEGQLSLEEFNIAEDAQWQDLNPLTSSNSADELIYDLISEPLVLWSPDQLPTKTGLVRDWEQISENHFKFHLRDNIFWSPSYNVTMNSDDSTSLDSSPIMTGLKGENSTGENQQVKAEDAVFTLLSNAFWTTDYEWLSSCYIDPINDLAFHITIDGNPETVEEEIFADFLAYIQLPVLPEFFLNSTVNTIYEVGGGIPCIGIYPEIENTAVWQSFGQSAFGCGKYMLYYTNQNVETVLERNENWSAAGAIIGELGLEPFVEKFRIRYISKEADQLAEFKAGKLEYFEGLILKSFSRTDRTDPRFEIQAFLDNSYSLMAFNLERRFIGSDDNLIWLNDSGAEGYTKALAVRKAMCYAIDRDELNQILYDGEQLIVNNVIFPYSACYYYNDVSPKYNHDLEKACEWMELAGYKNPNKADFPMISSLAVLSIIIILYRKRRRLSTSKS